jgi:hypothetical protein
MFEAAVHHEAAHQLWAHTLSAGCVCACVGVRGVVCEQVVGSVCLRVCAHKHAPGRDGGPQVRVHTGLCVCRQSLPQRELALERRKGAHTQSARSPFRQTHLPLPHLVCVHPRTPARAHQQGVGLCVSARVKSADASLSAHTRPQAVQVGVQQTAVDVCVHKRGAVGEGSLQLCVLRRRRRHVCVH